MLYPDYTVIAEIQTKFSNCADSAQVHALRMRINRVEHAAPLLVHYFAVWEACRDQAQRAYQSNDHQELTKHILALRLVEGSLAMLLAVVELNETPIKAADGGTSAS